jgi:hypothetical protein
MPKKTLKDFDIPARITKTAIVRVRATDADAAIDQFNKLDWFDETVTDTADWVATGPPQESR